MQPEHGTPQRLSKIADGGSAEVYAWGENQVLKLFRHPFPREAVETELRHARIAHGLGIPTPRPDGIAYFKGRTGIVFEHCEGATLYELLAAGTESPRRLAAVLFDVQQSVHRLRCPDFPAMEERLARRILRARDVSGACKQQALGAVRALSTEDRLCHGDFHPINVLLTPSGPVILDWLDACRGDPAAEVVRSLLMVEYARPDAINTTVRRDFLEAYWALCREAWADRLDRLDGWRLPMAIVRLTETRDESERQNLLRVVAAAGARRA
jgi:thiamine kinase